MRALLLSLLLVAPAAAQEKPAFPKFRTQEIDTGLSIGYAVLVADLDGDKKPDIVVVDKHKVVWYQNPTWKKRVIVDGKTTPDNVCAAALDIDADGKLDLVVGAAWKPFDTKNPGTLQWLKNPGDAEKEWPMFPIPCDEPTVHRVRVADLDGDGKPELLMAPLMGREATQKANWMDGRPVRILSYKIPAKDPEKTASWKPEVISDQLRVVHNFEPLVPRYPAGSRTAVSILTASYGGVHALLLKNGKVDFHNFIGTGDQANPTGNRGSSEVKGGYYSDPTFNGLGSFSAAIEPWHGNKVVVYTTPVPGLPVQRTVVDDKLRWGHAVWCADFDGDKCDELIIGVRDNPGKGDTHTEKCGVRVYKNTDGRGTKWERLLVDEGGVAVEDLAVADLDGDGKPDIVAVGRATKNCRIYWNK